MRAARTRRPRHCGPGARSASRRCRTSSAHRKPGSGLRSAGRNWWWPPDVSLDEVEQRGSRGFELRDPQRGVEEDGGDCPRRTGSADRCSPHRARQPSAASRASRPSPALHSATAAPPRRLHSPSAGTGAPRCSNQLRLRGLRCSVRRLQLLNRGLQFRGVVRSSSSSCSTAGSPATTSTPAVAST